MAADDRVKADLRRLEAMTEEIGLLEHSIFAIPDRLEGYSIDDNARALQVVVRNGVWGERELRLARIYLKFLLSARGENGFHNDLGADMKWIDQDSLGEAYGRAMEALGETAADGPMELALPAALVFDQKSDLVTQLHSIRTKAHLIWALYHRSRFKENIQDWEMMRCFSKKDSREFGLKVDCRGKVCRLADEMCNEYQNNRSDGWKWFEDVLTYDNARLPWGLFGAYKMTGKEKYLHVAKESLDWLIKEMWDDDKDCFSWVGFRGWWKKGGEKAKFGQQAIDACGMVEACMEAIRASGENKYREKAQAAYEWFTGRNVGKINLVDEATGGVKDGLEEEGYNPNEGAESILCYLFASQEINR
jgi:hypothetical protein